MTPNERLLKLATANHAMLASVDAVLNGTDDRMVRAEADCRLITYTEAAKRLNVSRPTVYRLVRAGRLEIVPLAGANRITMKSVIDLATGTTR